MAEVASSAAPAPAAGTPAAAADAAAPAAPAPMEVDNVSEDPILVSLESEAKHVAHAPLVDPDAVEMRLLPLLDSEGRLQDGTEVGARVHALCEKIPREAETTKGVLLVVLRRTCALVEEDNGKKLAMRAFLNAGGLRPLGTWLERADRERSDDFVRLLLDALSDLPVTARLVKASDVGKIVKRLKKDRKEAGDANMDSAYKGLMQNWYEKANKGDDEEEKKLVALEAQARKATEKKKRSAKKRSSQPTDVLASALHQKKRAKVPDEAMDRSRAARIEARRQGRSGGGVETIQLAHEGHVLDDDGRPITSRSIDPELAERLAKRTTRVKWADDSGGEIASYCEPVEGWLDDGGHHGPSQDDGLTAKERQKREREMEAQAMGKAKELENAEKRAEEVEYQRKLDGQKPQIAWREPPPLKLGEDVAEPEVVATEPATQASRQKRLMEARYFHARDIPDNPAEDGMETFRIDGTTVEIPAQELEKQPDPVEEPEPAPVPPPPQDVWTAPTPTFTPSFGQQPPPQNYYPPAPPRAANAAPRGLPEAITRLDEDALRFLLQNQALYDSLFVEGQLDESRLRDVIANFRRGPRR